MPELSVIYPKTYISLLICSHKVMHNPATSQARQDSKSITCLDKQVSNPSITGILFLVISNFSSRGRPEWSQGPYEETESNCRQD